MKTNHQLQCQLTSGLLRQLMNHHKRRIYLSQLFSCSPLFHSLLKFLPENKKKQEKKKRKLVPQEKKSNSFPFSPLISRYLPT